MSTFTKVLLATDLSPQADKLTECLFAYAPIRKRKWFWLTSLMMTMMPTLTVAALKKHAADWMGIKMI